MKAEEKLQALKNAGVNVDNYFAVSGADGNGIVCKIEDGILSVVDGDPGFLHYGDGKNGILAAAGAPGTISLKADLSVVKGIKDGGTLNVPRLFRRWVMGQMSRAETDGYHHGLVEWLRAKGYDYSMGMMLKELKAQAKMLHNGDAENFAIRNMWFNKELAADMLILDIKQTKELFDRSTLHKCKGRFYIHICGGYGNVFRDELESKILQPLHDAAVRVSDADTPQKLYEAFRGYYKIRVKLNGRESVMHPGFVDAYKAVGAYYTLQNMFLFHGCFLQKDGEKLYGYEALDELNRQMKDAGKSMADDGPREGWRFLGLMRNVIKYNGIDMNAKREEWRKARLERRGQA